MQLAWQTDNESKQDIKAAMLAVREVQCSLQLALPCQLSRVLTYAWLHALQTCCACTIVLCSSWGLSSNLQSCCLLAFKAVTDIELKVAGDFVGAGLSRHVSGD